MASLDSGDIVTVLGGAYVQSCASYVSTLARRARSTEDVDILIEQIGEEAADEPAEMLDNGDNIRVVPTDQVAPHLEVKFALEE